ncbi:MAG: hypothetical protein QOI04_541 [Verrucomicrobiota bacterium]|jgi:hypothetical protein
MKKFCIIPMLVALTLLVSCGKQQTEEESRAEIDREVQQKLDAQHQVEDQQKLAQEKADLDAREKALAEKESSPVEESRSRTERTERVTREMPESRGSKSYDMFYTRLERYGDWRETSDYGYVWQPREAQSRTWRPYTNGHWVYSDAGWTWVSEEPFGWAAYHYGRWVRLRNIGWIWVPGDEWAPAWVSWRTSNEYVGWAPLPPEARFDRRTGIHKWADNYYDIGPDQYCFVAQNEFGSQRVERAVVAVERNVTIVNQTTNVTNITYSNTTVINQGPSYDEMRAHSREPIQRYRLERRSDVNDQSERAVVRGEVLEISAPTITAQITQRPRTTKAPILQVSVERDWAGGNQPAAQQARAKMKAEAAPPADAPPKTFVKPETTANAQAAPTAAASASTSTTTSTAETSATVSSTPPTRSRASVAPVASANPTVAITATPTATATATPTPRPRASTTPIPTSTPSYTESPTARSTTSSAASATPAITPDRTMQNRQMEQRLKAQEQQRRHEEKLSAQPRMQNERKTGGSQFETPPPATTPASSLAPTATPSATNTPSSTMNESAAAPFAPTGKNKKQNKPERAAPAEEAASVTPSPSASVSAATSSTTSASLPAAENEKKFQKQKHERGKFGAADSSPTPTPSPTP